MSVSGGTMEGGCMRLIGLPVNDALGDDENLWMTSQQSIFSVLTETTEFEK